MVELVKEGKSNQKLFAFMGYTCGDPEAGMGGDEFEYYGKFYAKNIDDARDQLAKSRKDHPEIIPDDTAFSSVYVTDYAPEIEGRNPTTEVFSSFDDLIKDIESNTYPE